MKQFYRTINGVRHHFCRWGNPKKPKLFFFHGWMDMAASFDFVARHLERDFDCIAPDWRGFGKSAHSANPLGYFFYEYVADALAVINLFSPDKPVSVVAHSMGGNILAFLAGAMPDRIRHFVNVEGFGIQDMPGKMGPERMRAWLSYDAKKKFRIYAQLKEIASRLRQTNPRLPEKRALFLAKHLSKRVKGGYQIAADPRHKQMGPYLHQLNNVYPFWENIQAQCLLVTAEKTEMASWVKYIDSIEAEIDRRLSHFPKSAKRYLVKDCGHMVHHEKPEELAKLVREFINKY